eukprot:COSAG02_NODE_888_length_16167_cov_293.783234_5_plen_140_part_00
MLFVMKKHSSGQGMFPAGSHAHARLSRLSGDSGTGQLAGSKNARTEDGLGAVVELLVVEHEHEREQRAQRGLVRPEELDHLVGLRVCADLAVRPADLRDGVGEGVPQHHHAKPLPADALPDGAAPSEDDMAAPGEGGEL